MSAALTAAWERLAEAPEFFPHRIDWWGRRALLVRLDAQTLRAAPFLDERVLAGRTGDGGWVPLDGLLTRAGPLVGRTPQMIFHLGHCGSTLLSRLLDALPGVLGLREPLPLRLLAELAEELPRPEARLDAPRWQALADALFGLYDRAHPGSDRRVIKATSSCNALIAPWCERYPKARGVLLHIGLDDWLATLLKSPSATADALQFAPARLLALRELTGDTTLRLAALADAEQLALGWLAERARFAAARAAHPERLLAVDFARVLAEGPSALARIAAHLGVAATPDAVARAWSPERLGEYAKAPGHAYGPGDRAADLAEAHRRFGPAIARGRRWAETLAARHPALAALLDD